MTPAQVDALNEAMSPYHKAAWHLIAGLSHTLPTDDRIAAFLAATIMQSAGVLAQMTSNTYAAGLLTHAADEFAKRGEAADPPGLKNAC